jgi:hypothetical protein
MRRMRLDPRHERSRRGQLPRTVCVRQAASYSFEKPVNRREAAVGVDRLNGHLANIIRVSGRRRRQ